MVRFISVTNCVCMFYSGAPGFIFIILFLGLKLKGVADAAKNYHVVLEENRRLYNEVQELKGKTIWVIVLCLHSTILSRYDFVLLLHLFSREYQSLLPDKTIPSRAKQ